MIRKFMLLVLLAGLAGIAVLAVQSRDEIERYLKLSRM
ncbi:DUF6893 family small protein [Pseudonocardia acidicola]